MSISAAAKQPSQPTSPPITIRDVFALAGNDGTFSLPSSSKKKSGVGSGSGSTDDDVCLHSPDFLRLLSSSIDSQTLHDLQLDAVFGGGNYRLDNNADLASLYDVYRQSLAVPTCSNSSSSSSSNNSNKDVVSKEAISQATASELLDYSNEALIQCQRISNKVRKLKHLEETRAKQQREIATLLEEVMDIEQQHPSFSSSSSNINAASDRQTGSGAGGSSGVGDDDKSVNSASWGDDVKSIRKLPSNLKHFEFKFLCKLLEISSNLLINQDPVESSGKSPPKSSGSSNKLAAKTTYIENPASGNITSGYDLDLPLDARSQQLLDTICLQMDTYINSSIRQSIMSLSASAVKETKFYENISRQVANNGINSHGGGGKNNSNNSNSNNDNYNDNHNREGEDIDIKVSIRQLDAAFESMSTPYCDFNKLSHSFLLDSFLKRPVRANELHSIVATVVTDIRHILSISPDIDASMNENCSSSSSYKESDSVQTSSCIRALISQLLFGSNFDPALDSSEVQTKADLAERSLDTGNSSSGGGTCPGTLNTTIQQFACPDQDWQQLSALRARHIELLLRVKQAFGDYSPYHAEVVLGGGELMIGNATDAVGSTPRGSPNNSSPNSSNNSSSSCNNNNNNNNDSSESKISDDAGASGIGSSSRGETRPRK